LSEQIQSRINRREKDTISPSAGLNRYLSAGRRSPLGRLFKIEAAELGDKVTTDVEFIGNVRMLVL
jgi:hypothetical protein